MLPGVRYHLEVQILVGGPAEPTPSEMSALVTIKDPLEDSPAPAPTLVDSYSTFEDQRVALMLSYSRQTSMLSVDLQRGVSAATACAPVAEKCAWHLA